MGRTAARFARHARRKQIRADDVNRRVTSTR